MKRTSYVVCALLVSGILFRIPAVAASAQKFLSDRPLQKASLKDVSSRVREAGQKRGRIAANLAAPETVELKSDDGTPDGTGIVGDGLLIVNRLTPPRYPAIVRSVRLYFVEFEGDTAAVGKKVRLVLFTDPEGKGTPPAAPEMRIDRYITIPAKNQWLDFPLDGPVLQSGDLYVGYESPDPYDGIGFACDTSGVQQDRAWYSFDSGETFRGPLRMSNGTKTNVLMRATVLVQDPDADLELRTDDGVSETGLLKGAFLAVNRLTPPHYPAKLTSVRLYFEQFNNLPSPVGKNIRVVVFVDPAGGGKPPAGKPAFDVDRSETISAIDRWLDIQVDGPTIQSGDFYVGFQTPADPGGVVFSADTDSAHQYRAFYSEDAGATFRGPLALINSANQTIDINLLIRGVASFPGSSPATPSVQTFDLSIDRQESNVVQGESARFEIRIKAVDGAADPGEIALSAKLDTAGIEGVTANLGSAAARAGDTVPLTVTAAPKATARTAAIQITARSGSEVRTRTISVNVWKVLASGVLGPNGGSITDGESRVSLTAPAGALSSDTPLQILSGDSNGAASPNRASDGIRIQGLPTRIEKPLRVSLPLSAPADGVFLVVERDRFLKNAATAVPMQRLLPTSGSTTQRTAEIPAPPSQLPLGDVNLWLVSGYEQLRASSASKQTAAAAGSAPEITFEITYPKELATQAATILDLLIKAAHKLAFTPNEGLNMPFNGVPNNTIPVDILYLSNGWFGGANTVRYGDSDGESIRFNAYKLGGTDPWAMFRTVPGHELFHVSQNFYGGSGRDAQWLWMDDATATWFEAIATENPGHVPSTVFGGSGEGELNTDAYVSFIREGLIFQPQFAKGTGENPPAHHGYGASMFLTWLGRRYSPGMEVMGDIARARENTATPNEAITAALSARGATLPDMWRSFVRDYLEGNVYPNQTLPTPDRLTPTASANVAVLFTSPQDSGKLFPEWASPDLSAEFYQIKFPNPAKPPDLTDDVVLSFGFAPGYTSKDAGVLVASYADKKVLGESWGGDPVELPVKDLIQKRDVLLAAVANSRNSPPNEGTTGLRLNVKLADPKATITPRYMDFVGVVNGTYDFNTKNVNVPADATYSWNFGDGTASSSTRSVKHQFTKAGAFEVSLTVSGADIPTLRDSVTVQIAPDIEVKKAEMTFYVYRVMSSKQKQASQNFRIWVYDADGKVVDSGDSVAKNGVWECVLPAGRTFSVEVQYNYTLPPCSGKTPKRTFTTKEGLNFIEIETASCGA
jgi:hypothetical protein